MNSIANQNIAATNSPNNCVVDFNLGTTETYLYKKYYTSLSGNFSIENSLIGNKTTETYNSTLIGWEMYEDQSIYKGSHVRYKIVSENDHVDYTFACTRRFSDFVFLKHILSSQYKGMN